MKVALFSLIPIPNLINIGFKGGFLDPVGKFTVSRNCRNEVDRHYPVDSLKSLFNREKQ